MEKSVKIMSAVGVIGFVLVASAAALQEDDGWFQKRTSEIFVRRVERQLNITDTQREQIRAILKIEQPTIQSLASRVHEEQEELRAEPAFDEGRVRAFTQEHESTLEDVMVEREKVRMKILAVLTPEQRAEATKLRETLYARFSDRLAMLGDEL